MEVSEIYQKVKNLILAKITQFTLTEIWFHFWICFDSWKKKPVETLEMCPGQNTCFSARSKNNSVEQRELYCQTLNPLYNSSNAEINILKLSGREARSVPAAAGGTA